MKSTSVNLDLKDAFPYLLLFILSFLTLGNIINHPFMVDDFYFLIKGEHFSFTRDFSGFFTRNSSIHFAPLNFLLNTALFHYFRDPAPLYFINILLFFVNCSLLFYFVRLISKNMHLGLLTSVLFCVHPMNAEIVGHITFNTILILSAFMQMSLIMLHHYRENGRKTIHYVSSLLFFVAALLCQEIAFLLPLYALGMLWCLLDTDIKKSLRTLIPFVLLTLFFVGLWLIMAKPNARLLQSVQAFHLSFWDISAHFCRLISWYLSNLILPHNILFAYSVPLSQSQTLLWNLLLLGLGLSAAWALIYFQRSLAGFAVILFLTGFIYAVPAGLSHPDTGLIFEPFWIYFSFSGFCLLAAIFLLELKANCRPRIYLALLSALLIFFFTKSQTQAHLSDNEQSYYEYWLRETPDNYFVMFNLVKLYGYEENAKIPQDLIPPMITMVDRLIQNGLFRNASKLIEKLSIAGLSKEQAQTLRDRSDRLKTLTSNLKE